MADVELFFRNEKTGAMFKVVGQDLAAGTITLKGDYGEFTEPYSKERFVELGYKLVKQAAPRDDADAETEGE